MGNYQSLMYKKILNKVQQQMTLNKLNKICSFTDIESKDLQYLKKHAPKINGRRVIIFPDGSRLAEN